MSCFLSLRTVSFVTDTRALIDVLFIFVLAHIGCRSHANLEIMSSVWKRLQRVNKRAAKFQFTVSYHQINLETTPKW